MSSKYILFLTRFSFFLIYSWFGVLKIFNLGEAYPLVSDLCIKVFTSIDPEKFFVYFGILELYIGIIFFIPRLSKFAVIITSLHLITTFLPLFLLPIHTWISPFQLSMEGQYILKNVFLIPALIYIWKSSSEI